MLNLIKKEFKVSKSWIFLLFLSIVFSFTIFMSTAAVEITGIKFIENVAFSYAVLMIVYVSIVDSSYRDIKNKSEVILNSFPIDRKNIVRGKYIIMILYIIMYSLPMWLTNKIFMPIIYGGESHLEILWSLMIITTISLIFYSIYYPLYFKSEDGLMTFSQVFRLIIIML
ncbi:MAG: ABC-2 transporter permease, partial [Tissierellia bacterium]|nr:ABC-2 transporter permease [Tissierellia bacterium]